jgi:hypothetical protein
VGDLENGCYGYDHCIKGRAGCDDPYIREERLLRELAGTFRQLMIAPATLPCLEAAVTEFDKTIFLTVLWSVEP